MRKKYLTLVSATAAVMLMGISAGFSQVSFEHRWDMSYDPVTKTVFDTVGGANGLLVGGATISGGVLTPVNGVNPAGGSGQGVNLTADAVAGIDGAFSIEVWYTRVGESAYKTLFAFTGGEGKNSDNYLIAVQKRGGNEQSSAFKWNGIEKLALGAPNAQNQLSQVITTFSDGIASFYLNGVLQSTITDIDPAFQLSSLTTLMGIGGNSPWPDEVLQGTISDFRIYSGALDDSQISALYALGADATNEQIFAVVPEPEAYAIGMLALLALLIYSRSRRVRMAA